MVEAFFHLRPATVGESSSNDTTCLLSGPPTSGKTSLLFQFAYNAALHHDDAFVVFICNQERLRNKPPHLSQSVDPTSDVFKRIQMKYVQDDQGIKSYFAAFHLLDAFPAAVVVDDFGDFFNERTCRERYDNARGRDMALVRTLALCRSAVDYANERSSCRLLLSDMHLGDSPRSLFIYRKWVKSIFTIRDDGMGSFYLKNSLNSGFDKLRRKQVARYSIANQCLKLHSLAEEDG
uniref:Uncharacterized protein n=1 Tax=Kalanchoe fedtschenkoi TaxID=63787 RepID=A0A7N0UTK5_KALFE